MQCSADEAHQKVTVAYLMDELRFWQLIGPNEEISISALAQKQVHLKRLKQEYAQLHQVTLMQGK